MPIIRMPLNHKGPKTTKILELHRIAMDGTSETGFGCHSWRSQSPLSSWFFEVLEVFVVRFWYATASLKGGGLSELPYFFRSGKYGLVGLGSSPAPGTRAAQSMPRWTISRACSTLKSAAA